MTIILDPGHGMGNRTRGKYDPGATSGGVQEASIVMSWANCLRKHLMALGHKVVRTRVNATDPCPVSRRDDIAVAYGGKLMLSFHCNAATGLATGTEVFYRGADDKAFAEKLAAMVSANLGIRNRGAKTEASSQHSSLAVLDFDKCWLIELGFIDNPSDRNKMLDPALMEKTCAALARLILDTF